jgi:hypothetical protein
MLHVGRPKTLPGPDRSFHAFEARLCFFDCHIGPGRDAILLNRWAQRIHHPVKNAQNYNEKPAIVR